jgi:DNA-binding transcriptional LysR family regulator
LEASLETTLFTRSGNGVSLTERGTHLRERVQDVFAIAHIEAEHENDD